MKNKKMNPILKSMIVLSSISVVCVILLSICNTIFAISDEERFARGMANLITADRFETVYDRAEKEPSKINDFNRDVPHTMLNGDGIDGSVIVVYKAVGGENDGKYVIESEAKGYASYIKVLTALFTNGTVYGMSIKEMGKGESYANKLNYSDINSSLVGISAGDIAINTTSPTQIGASFTYRGIINCVNLASEFYRRVVLNQTPSEPEKTEPVNAGTVKNNLDGLLNLVSETTTGYTKYLISTTSKAYDVASTRIGNGRVASVFISDDNHIILDIRGSYGTYGSCTLYALMDTNTKTIRALKRVAGGSELSGIGHTTDSIFGDLILNNTFADKTIDELFPMEDYINNTTGATESNNGVKGAVYCALDKLDYVLEQITLIDTEISQKEGE